MNNNCPIHTIISPSTRLLPAVQLAQACDRYILANGVQIPCLGFGTYMVPPDGEGLASITSALKLGFRHIDTAAAYGNEAIVAQALEDVGLARSDVFITSKLRNPDQGYESTFAAFERSCAALKTDYLDLYLIHWPRDPDRPDAWKNRIVETWSAFEELYQAGRIRAIGVSNFLVHHMEVLKAQANILPMVNQIELNPSYQQREIVRWCEQHGVQLEAWAPLGRSRLMHNPEICALAARYGKDPGQICVRYALQKGFVTMPKSSKLERIKSNAQVFDFELSIDDLAMLDALDDPQNYTFHPDRLPEWKERVARAHADERAARNARLR
ncbi:aldo/keto reductase [Collinsella sp. zg1085]|uniref:aldo/keto reductase n=1 Tax=Collinsella sp. zg1085 TaxID=2844380 RepID=UPI001C0DED74|nr:aldo/keto reductase [Collinsella sp. zg1085]QWT17415.1 aldo/keto reductase [Collinsella sp. zg1085]